MCQLLGRKQARRLTRVVCAMKIYFYWVVETAARDKWSQIRHVLNYWYKIKSAYIPNWASFFSFIKSLTSSVIFLQIAIDKKLTKIASHWVTCCPKFTRTHYSRCFIYSILFFFFEENSDGQKKIQWWITERRTFVYDGFSASSSCWHDKLYF